MSLTIPASLNSSSLASVAPLAPPASTDSASSPFKDVLGSAIEEVEGSRANAAESINQFLSGQGEDLHSTILASQRADLEFQMFLQVRNKVVSAYQEIMKMQL
jgi:flagellar hook-basal body complex protein FliE